MAAAPQQPLTFSDVFDDEDDGGEVKEAPTVHHIRANSSIMQIKKILGEPTEPHLGAPASMPSLKLPVLADQLLTEAYLLLSSRQSW